LRQDFDWCLLRTRIFERRFFDKNKKHLVATDETVEGKSRKQIRKINIAFVRKG
jgi:hypothetical protein